MHILLRSMHFLSIIFIIGLSACVNLPRSALDSIPTANLSSIAPTINPEKLLVYTVTPHVTASVSNKLATVSPDDNDFGYMPWVPKSELEGKNPEQQLGYLVNLRLKHFENPDTGNCLRILDFKIESMDMSEKWTKLIDDPMYSAIGWVLLWVRPVQKSCAWVTADSKDAIHEGYFIIYSSRLYGIHQENQGYQLIDLTQKAT